MNSGRRESITPKKHKSNQTTAGEIFGRPYWPRIPDGEYLAAPAQQFANKFRELKFLVMRGGL